MSISEVLSKYNLGIKYPCVNILGGYHNYKEKMKCEYCNKKMEKEKTEEVESKLKEEK